MSDLIGNRSQGGRRLAATLFAALLFLLSGSPAAAGSFQVNPVNIELAAGETATSFTIKNIDDAPVAVRVHSYKWTQAHGRDVRTETREVIISPPIFTIPAGATQIVRLGLRNRTAGDAYRIVVEEIPGPKPAGVGIQVALRLDLPFYVLKEGGSPDITWAWWRNVSGELVLEARNHGSRHAQVIAIEATGPTGAITLLSSEMGVILPGGARQWTIDNDVQVAPGTPLLLNVSSASGETRANVIFESR